MGGGSVETKDNGVFMVVPDSMYHTKNGLSSGIAYEDLGVTVNPKYANFVNELKNGLEIKQKDGSSKKIKLENIEDLENYNKEFMETHNGKGLLISINGRTLVLQDFINYFKYNINPNFIQSKIENKLNLERLGEKKVNTQLIITLAMAFLIMSIGYMVISNFLKNNSYETKYVQCREGLAQCQTARGGIISDSSSTQEQTEQGNEGKSGILPISIN